MTTLQLRATWRHNLAFREELWAKEADRIVTEGINPEQAVLVELTAER